MDTHDTKVTKPVSTIISKFPECSTLTFNKSQTATTNIIYVPYPIIFWNGDLKASCNFHVSLAVISLSFGESTPVHYAHTLMSTKHSSTKVCPPRLVMGSDSEALAPLSSGGG